MIWSCPSPISTAWYAAVRVWFESVASRQVYSNERDAEGMTDRGRELADIVPAPVGGYQGTITPQQHGEDVKLARKTPVFLSAVLLTINGLAFAGDLIGQVSVIDGDTIEIHGTGIRIFGIDAPESISFAGMKTANSTDADKRHRMRCSTSLIVVPSNASR